MHLSYCAHGLDIGSELLDADMAYPTALDEDHVNDDTPLTLLQSTMVER